MTSHRGSSSDGIALTQSFDYRKKITGFDILDTIAPERAVQPRVQTLDAWREGWSDLISELGVLTIFGNGFGGLIRPSEGSQVCQHWQCLPEAQDYMAASVSTLHILHEQLSKRRTSELGAGELTKKIAWHSVGGPLKPPVCAADPGLGTCHSNPVQLLSMSSWFQGLKSTSPNAVDIMGLDKRGVVIFGHRPKPDLGLGRGSTGAGSSLGSSGEQSTEDATPTSNSGSQMGPGTGLERRKKWKYSYWGRR